MTTSTKNERAATPAAETTATPEASPPAWYHRLLPPTLLAVLVPILGLVPLARNPFFYYWDDTAAAFTPAWRIIGQRLLAGSWPTMIPELWTGGNLAAESLLGIFNPVILADAVFIGLVPDLAIGITLVKLQFAAILAVGVYLLCREYRANRPMAFVAGLAMPFAGYTLYFDSAAWASALIAFSWVPHVWWSTRKAANGRTNPFVAFVFGFLTMSTGNPYGAIAVVVVYLALLVELLASKQLAASRSLVISGASVALTGAIVYLPLALSTQVTVRTETGIHNDRNLVPGLGDLLNLSAPTYAPVFRMFGSYAATFPVMYLLWFLVPLLPWMRWHTLRSLGRGSLSLLVFGSVYGVLVLAPSDLGLFRWPARLTEYAQLPVLVAVAVCLSAGLRRDHLSRRLAATGVLLLLQTYLGWAKQPELLGVQTAGFALAVLLTGLTLAVHYRRPRWLSVPLALGGVVVFVLQVLAWFPGNFNVTPWYFPHDTPVMQQTYGSRYPGTTYVIADSDRLPEPTESNPGWQNLLFGSVWHAAGVDSINAYSGIGYRSFTDYLCLTYYGGVNCDDAINRLTQTAPGTHLSMLEAMRIDTVVVQTGAGYEGNLEAALPAGWTVTREDGVTVARRDRPWPWPSGRLSDAAPGVAITSDTAVTDREEHVRYTGSGKLVFARLDWPGWTAEVDGRPVSTGATPQGLLTVDVPHAAPGGSTVSIRWKPPGLDLGLVLFGLGAALALAQGARYTIGVRRRTGGGSVATDQSPDSPFPAE